MTLVEFLSARLDEDEAAARDAYYDGQRWVPEEEAVVAADRDLDPILFLDRKRDAAHAARWSPARVLREVEAKRVIVNGVVRVVGADDRQTATSVIVVLAAIYADHPDYRQEWKV